MAVQSTGALKPKVPPKRAGTRRWWRSRQTSRVEPRGSEGMARALVVGAAEAEGAWRPRSLDLGGGAVPGGAEGDGKDDRRRPNKQI